MSDFTSDKQQNKMFGRRVLQTHEIGDFQLIEAIDADKKSHFHIYIDGRSIGYSAASIEEALIVAIAHRYDGNNSQAAHYFMRMIGLHNE